MKIYFNYLHHLLHKRFVRLTKSCCHLKNLYSLEQFKLRIAVEKRRAERGCCKSSIILLDLKPLVNGNGEKNRERMKDSAILICTCIRAVDAVSIFKNATVMILLVDADCSGAQNACKRIIRKIMNYCSSREPLTYNDFHIKILSFPEKKFKSTKLDEHPPTKRKTILDHRKGVISVKTGMTFKTGQMLNLRISSFNGTAISVPMDEVYFGDHDLFSNYLLTVKKCIKKAMDIAGALMALVLSLPIMAAVAIAIKATSKGPVLFKQIRVGYKGKCFIFFKFRTMMAHNKDKAHKAYVRKLINGQADQINMGTKENPCFKIKNDPRVTSIGRYLRRTSLDELPQLLNVLKGDMSLVGPRPPIPYEVSEYQKWHQRRVLDVKPGITGLWQVSGRNRTSFDEMVRLDIKYAENWSLKLDLYIILKTVLVMFKADGE